MQLFEISKMNPRTMFRLFLFSCLISFSVCSISKLNEVKNKTEFCKMVMEQVKQRNEKLKPFAIKKQSNNVKL